MYRILSLVRPERNIHFWLNLKAELEITSIELSRGDSPVICWKPEGYPMCIE